MNQLTCKACGSNEFTWMDNGMFRCDHCGTKYTEEQVKIILSGRVEVAGVLSLDKKAQNAEQFIHLGEYEKAREIFTQIINDYPEDYRGWFGVAKIDHFYSPPISCSPTKDTLKDSTEFKHALLVSNEKGRQVIDGFYQEYLNGISAIEAETTALCNRLAQGDFSILNYYYNSYDPFNDLYYDDPCSGSLREYQFGTVSKSLRRNIFKTSSSVQQERIEPFFYSKPSGAVTVDVIPLTYIAKERLFLALGHYTAPRSYNITYFNRVFKIDTFTKDRLELLECVILEYDPYRDSIRALDGKKLGINNSIIRFTPEKELLFDTKNSSKEHRPKVYTRPYGLKQFVYEQYPPLPRRKKIIGKAD